MYRVLSAGRRSEERLDDVVEEKSLDNHKNYIQNIDIKTNAVSEYYFWLTIPVASLTTAMSVGLPRPDRKRTADTILRYKLSSSSRVLARLSVISRITGCKRDSKTR